MDVRIVFLGRVQGVGFRYRAEEFALEIGVLGTVRNLADGSVELCAQGTRENIDTLVERLKKHFGRYIEHVDAVEVETNQVFTDFRVVR